MDDPDEAGRGVYTMRKCRNCGRNIVPETNAYRGWTHRVVITRGSFTTTEHWIFCIDAEDTERTGRITIEIRDPRAADPESELVALVREVMPDDPSNLYAEDVPSG